MSENNSSWKSPTTIIAITTLVLSIAVNVYQYVDSNRKFTLEEAKVELQKSGQTSQSEQSKSKLKVVLTQISSIDRELDSLKGEIEPYNNTIFKSQLAKSIAEGKVQNSISAGGKEAFQRNVDLAEKSIQWATGEKHQLVERVQELEKQKNELLKQLAN